LSDEERSQGISLYSLFTYMPGIIGPVIALALWDWGGMDAFVGVLIVIAASTGIFGFTTPVETGGQAAHESGHSPEQGGIWRSFAQVVTVRPLALCTWLMLGASVVFGAVTVFIPLYASQVAYGNAGLYMMVQAAVIVVARLVLRKRIPSDGIWRPRFVQGMIALAFVSALLLALASTIGPFAFYAAALLMGFAQAFLYPALTTYLTFSLPKASRNVLLGLFIASADLGISLGGLVMGPLADRLSYSGMYGVCAVLLIVLFGAEKIYRNRVT